MSTAYRFGPFTVLPEDRLLLRSGRPVRVGSHPFDILLVLCRHAGDAVSKETLAAAIWGDQAGPEGNLRLHMTALRKALDDGHAGHRYIADIPLRGYALVTPVTAVQEVTHSGFEESVRAQDPAAAASSLVHIIDDDPGVRNALDTLLRSVGMQTRTYGDAAAFLSAQRPDIPSCIVLDIRMPGMSGLDFQAQLNQHQVQLPIVFMTGFGDIAMSVKAMKAGAVDFLTKPFRDQDMLDAITRAIEVDRVGRAEQQDDASLRLRYSHLSPREREVMAQVVMGRMNKQIAADLGLSEITVKIHRGNAMRKMGARSLAALVKMASALRLEGAGSR
jgi:FixJ family two-component response regulator